MPPHTATDTQRADWSGGDEVEAAKLVLSRLGVDPVDLLTSRTDRADSPTFAEYISKVAEAVSAGTRRVYGTYWNYLVAHWGHRRLSHPTALEIKTFAEYVKAHVVQRRNARGGRSAMEHFIAAIRCIYNHAEADGVLNEADNPARKVAKPRRLRSTRRALSDARLEELARVAASTGNDPALDALLLRLHTETACRRGGALALRLEDLDPQQCLIRLQEKEMWRWQPVSPTLMAHLQAHAEERGAAHKGGQVLRYRNGRPLTQRRYDYLFARLGEHLPWVAAQQVSIHWLRHTTLTWVERNFGYAVAREYAGHTDRAGENGSAGTTAGTTVTYVRADPTEVVAALVALTGERHPLYSGDKKAP